MDTVWIDVAGIAIRKPITAGTNLLLGVQCLVYWRRLRSSTELRARLWGGFFAWMAVATLAGAVKHGLGPVLSASALLFVLWLSNVAGGLATYCAQRATIASHASARRVRPLEWTIRGQLGAFLATGGFVGPEMLLLVVNTAVGLLPVAFVEAASLLRGRRSGGWIASGLAVSVATGSVYLLGLAPAPWLGPIDIAHILMAVSFALIVRGSSTSGPDHVVRGFPLRGSSCGDDPPDPAIVHAHDGGPRRQRAAQIAIRGG